METFITGCELTRRFCGALSKKEKRKQMQRFLLQEMFIKA